MSIPTTFAPVKPQDFTLTPVKVNKSYRLTELDTQTTESGYTLVEGYHTRLKTPVGAIEALNDPINATDNSFKHIIWNSINHLYYERPYSMLETFEHHNERYAFKFLNASASYVSVPYFKYGEKIKKNTVTITNNSLGLTIIDDGNGNLYDPELESNIASFSRSNMIAYWGFNSEFRKFKFQFGTIESGEYEYTSHLFDASNRKSEVKNVSFANGPEISGSESGMSAVFRQGANSYGYIRTPHNANLNFDKLDQFTISFWFKPETQSETGSIISKNGVIDSDTFGMQPKTYAGSGQTTISKHISSSYVDSETNVYPYDFAWEENKLKFRRSDGIRTVLLETDVTSSQWNHVSVTRYNTSGQYRLKLFLNGDEAQIDVPDTTSNPLNHNDIMFGSKTQAGKNPYSGSLDEVRFINRAYYSGSLLDNEFYEKLSIPDYMYNTSVVGNVFYRRGNFVISPLNPKYKDLFSGSFAIDYKGVHTIYQYEALCRIKKGDFNLSTNPTTLISPNSDIIMDDMTGSLSPYFTTIGLYNSNNELLAVGKMGQPVKTRDDVDLNIVIKWDV